MIIKSQGERLDINFGNNDHLYSEKKGLKSMRKEYKMKWDGLAVGYYIDFKLINAQSNKKADFWV